MSKSLEARIYAFKVVHGNRYDYSRFTEESPIVVCRIHGPFKVSIANHMKGKVHCRDCSKITRLRKRRRELIPKLEGWLPEGHSLVSLSDDLKKFTMMCKNGRLERGAARPRGGVFRCEPCNAAEKAKSAKAIQRKPQPRTERGSYESYARLKAYYENKFGTLYQYGNFDPTLNNKQLPVICVEEGHGRFVIDTRAKNPRCPKCREEEILQRRLGVFFEKWRLHSPSHIKFNYLSSDRMKFNVTCTVHEMTRDYWTTNLKAGFMGCNTCGGASKRVTAQKDLLRKFKAAHGDRYDYSQVDYKGAGMKVIIVCRKHGPWETLPGNHYQGSGCWKCFSGASSVPERAWMKAIGDELGQSQTTTARVKGRRGGVCEADATFQNVVIEFDGAYWHGLPGSAAKDEYKNVELTNAGYHVIRLRNMLPPVAGALCFTVTEDPDPETVTRVVELVRELQGLSVA